MKNLPYKLSYSEMIEDDLSPLPSGRDVVGLRIYSSL